MFGRSQPTCPVDATTKEWVEGQMRWLTAKLGPDQVRYTDVILPTEVYFPHEYDAEPKKVLRLLRRVCRYMDIDHKVVRIKTNKSHQLARLERRQHAAATDIGRYYIWFEETLLDDAFAMVGALARELALVRLQVSNWSGDNTIGSVTEWRDPQFADLLQRQSFDGATNLAPIADLLTVLVGMGVFTANTVMIEKNWRIGYSASGWTTQLLGSLSMETYGYALALFAWYREEKSPTWAKSLQGTVEAAFKQSLSYLTKTGDSMFKPIEG